MNRAFLLHNNIDSAPVREACLDDSFYGRAYADITKLPKTIFMPTLHLLHGVSAQLANGSDLVAITQCSRHKRPTNVFGSTENQPHLLSWRIVLAGRSSGNRQP